MISSHEYENMAKQIGNQFVASKGQTTINSLATKIASDAKLNKEGIRTVVRLANVQVFENSFAAREEKKAEDRMVEFEVGDPEVVIANLYKDAEESHPLTIDSNRPNYDTTTDRYSDVSKVGHTKEASDGGQKQQDERKENLPQSVSVHTLKLAAAHMEAEKKQVEVRWSSTLEKAAQYVMVDLRNIPERIAFEKNALASLGAEYQTEIATVNAFTSPGQKVTNLFGGEKTAAVLNTHVGMDNPKHSRIIELVKVAHKARKRYEQLTQGLNRFKQDSFELR